jgi:hypothetical protein
MAKHEKPMMRLQSGRNGMFLVSTDSGFCFGRLVSMSYPKVDESGAITIEVEISPDVIETGASLDKPEGE